MKVFYSFLLCFILLAGKNLYAQFPYTDSFRNSTANGTVLGGGASLTATRVPGDTEGNGYLRLTENTADQSGFARNTSVFPSDKGLLVTFEYFSYGGVTVETADGICFFLFDATVINDPADPANGYPDPGFRIGGIGGSLGYAGYAGTPGLRKGFLGIGIDEFGNFATRDDGKKEGTIEVSGKIRQNVTLRGDGYGTSNGPGNYEFLTRVITTTLTPAFNVEGKVDGRTPGFNSSNPGYRKAIIEILPNGVDSYKINVRIIQGGVAAPHHPIKDYIYNNPIPPQLSYGLAASTGGFTNVHEVRNIDIVIPPSSSMKPVAVADVSTTTEDTPVTFNIISNDYDANGNYTLNLASIDLDPSSPGEQKTFSNADGAYSVSASGIVTFTPATHFNGNATSIPYTIKDDGSGGVVAVEESLTATISVTVTAVNDAPVATVPVTIEVTEDTPKALTGISFADPDAGSASVVASLTLPAGGGALSANSGGGVTVSSPTNALTLTGTLTDINAFIAGGGVTYTPVTNSNTDVTLTVGINDNGNVGAGGALSNSKTLILDIQPVNDAPVLTSISKTGNEDTVVPFSAADFTSKFSDVDGNSITKIKIISIPAATEGVLKKGDLAVVAGDEITFAELPTITFTPALNFNGPVPPFSWNAFDGTVYAVTNATINITITPVNDSPIVSNIDKTVAEEATLSFSSADFTGKYSDVENNPLVNITIVSLPVNGTLRKSGSPLAAGAVVLLSELASLTFVPATNFFGNTSFLWKASDGNSDAVSSAAVNIAVTPVDDPPVAVNDAATTESGSAVTFSVVANDTDPDGSGTIDVTTVDIDPASGTQNLFVVAGQGTYIANNNGSVTFTPVSNYDSGVGTATPIFYTVKDNTGLVSNSASIAVKVTPKVAPVANADEASTAENVAVTFNVLTNDTDANGNNTINTASVDLDPATGGRQNSFTVAGQGTYTVNNAGAVTFTPVQYYNSAAGTATPIIYTVSDVGGLTSNAATITITVTSVPDAPIAVADAVTTNEDNSVTFSVIANDIDRDGNNTIDPTSIDFDPGAGVKTSLTIAGEGTYTANTNGTVTFVPLANYNSGVTTATPISYTIKDNTGLTSNAASITVTVNSVNDLPVVANVPKTGSQGQTITFTDTDFKSKFTDPENSPLIRIRVVTLPQNGSLKLYGASITAGQEIPVADLEGITFVPLASFNGITSFSWNGNDGAGYAAVNANVVITLSAVNQPPVLTPVLRNYTGNSSVSFSASDFTSQFTDPEGNPLTMIQIVSLPALGTLKLFGVDVVVGQEIPVGDISGLTYVPEPGTSGTYNFRWNGSDGTVYANSASTVSINVTPTNVPPVVSGITKSGTGFTDITFTAADFTSKFTDADNNSLVKVKIINLPLNGTLKLNGINVITGQEILLADLSKLSFQSALNWSGTTNFAWNGYDGQAYAVNNANVTMTVILPVDPNAKIGAAKSLTSITDGINGTYDLKFTFTVANYGPNALENISLKDNLALALAGTEFTVKSVVAFGNLKANPSFNGNSDIELLLPASRLIGGEERKVELEINVKLVSKSGAFFNYAMAEGTSAITGAKVQDRSTNGLRADPVVNGDISLSETTRIDLAPRPTFIPEGFTPNNDGINDNLIIQNTLNQKIAIEVFNRWGNRVFRSVDYKNDWSGRCTEGIYLGQDIPDGTYFYVVVVDNKSKYVGSLTVQR